MTKKCKYCGNEIEGVVPAPSTCWTCYNEIGTEAVSVSEQLGEKKVEEIGFMNDESVSKVSSDVLFTGSGVYLRKVPVLKISYLIKEMLTKMDPDFSFNISTEGEFAEIFLPEDQLLYWAKKTFKTVIITSKVSTIVIFTGSGVYLKNVPISEISSILVDLRKKMDPDFSLNITTEGEFAELFLPEDQLLYWAKKTFKTVISGFIE